jgi:glycosyltransferase involved in cell wall biosynthesis
MYVESAPMFSIIIPVYNGARYIARAIISALHQKSVQHEVIVVDDGSTDGSGDIAAAVDPVVRVIRHETNRGLPAARNTGIRAARGNMIAFLDSDDWWVEEKLAAQAALFDAAPDVGVVFSDFAGVDLEGRPSGWQGGLYDQLPNLDLTLIPIITQDSYRLVGNVNFALIRHTSFMHPSTVTARREVFDLSGLFDEELRHMEDLEMWIRFATHTQIGLVNRVLVHIEQRPNSLGRQTSRANEYIIRLYSGFLSRFPNLPTELREHISRVLEATHIGLGWHYRTIGNLSAARQHYWDSLRQKIRLRTLAALIRTYLPKPLR